MDLSDSKTLKSAFIEDTLRKVERVLNMVLSYNGVEMQYNIDERNKIFCEVIKKTKKELTTEETFRKIQEAVWSNESINDEESEWISSKIYEYHRDLFVLHYFYAVLYSYNYDAELRNKITELHVKQFFVKSNDIYKKYKDLRDLKNKET